MARRWFRFHRRLAIIDLTPAGAQPMLSGDGNVGKLYLTGCIYNFAGIRRELERSAAIYFDPSAIPKS